MVAKTASSTSVNGASSEESTLTTSSATKPSKSNKGVKKASNIRKLCTHPSGCTNIIINSGLCIKHGARKKIRKICSHVEMTAAADTNNNYDTAANNSAADIEGSGAVGVRCTKYAKKGGLCFKHHGKIHQSTRKICVTEGCGSVAQRDGLCRRHNNSAAASVGGCNSKRTMNDDGGEGGEKSESASVYLQNAGGDWRRHIK